MSFINDLAKFVIDIIRGFFGVIVGYAILLAALLLAFGFIAAFGKELESANSINVLTLFTLPLVIGTLIKENKKIANSLLFSSTFLITGYLIFTLGGEGGKVNPLFAQFGGILLLIGSFAFSVGLLKIMAATTKNLIKSL